MTPVNSRASTPQPIMIITLENYYGKLFQSKLWFKVCTRINTKPRITHNYYASALSYATCDGYIL